MRTAPAALDRLESLPGRDAALHAARGRIWAILGDTGKAEVDYKTALQLDPKNLLIHLDHGFTALKKGRTDEAASALVVALAHMPEKHDPRAARNQVDGPLVSSDAAFRRAVELRPDDTQLWIARGQHLAWRGRWKEAADAYSHGVERWPITHDWVEYACVLILADDLAGYRDFCGRVAKRVASPDGLKGGSDDEAYTQALAVRILSLHPNSGLAAET